MPVIPPIRNVPRNPAQNRSAVVNSIVPRHSVATQLNIFTPVGTAIRNDDIMKNTNTKPGLGVANMWCAQTSRLRNAMTTVDAAIAL